jgi:prevent-host-death family protein
MAEQWKPITEARQNLPNLCLDTQRKMERFIITNQGKPQSVLISYLDYQRMRAATEFILQPLALASVRRGLAQHRSGNGLTSAQVREKLKGSESPAQPAAGVKAELDEAMYEGEV